jgi:TonB family protein
MTIDRLNVRGKFMKRNALSALLGPGYLTGVLATFLAFTVLPTVFSTTACSQGTQLSLADILIALRSKKASLPDRNKILTEAIATRGTTFALTPEIEKELSTTGATKTLLDSIRQRSQIAKISAADTKQRAEEKKTDPVAPAAVAPVPDFAFYEKRAGESVAKGEIDAAVVDYTKALEMNPASTNALSGRANCYIAKKAFVLGIADLTKIIELEGRNATAFADRGQAHEKNFEPDLALEDYKKAFELDPTIEVARTAVEKWKAKVQADENAKAAALAAAATKTEVSAKPAPNVAALEIVDLGTLTESQAIRMVKPAYPSLALQSHATGQVVLDVELDTEGNVTKAKIVSGPQFFRMASEDAARRSKFKPAMVGDKAVKATGRIVYNFVVKAR